jgi:hypothetical protein
VDAEAAEVWPEDPRLSKLELLTVLLIGVGELGGSSLGIFGVVGGSGGVERGAGVGVVRAFCFGGGGGVGAVGKEGGCVGFRGPPATLTTGITDNIHDRVVSGTGPQNRVGLWVPAR